MYNYKYIHFRAGFHLLPSRCHFSSNNIWEYQLKVAEAVSEDWWRLHISMIKIILSFIKSGHPSNHPTKPRWVRHRRGALCRLLHSWAGQSGSAAPSQTCAIKGMLPSKRHGVPKGWPKIILERPKAKCEAKNEELMICPLTSPNSITF